MKKKLYYLSFTRYLLLLLICCCAFAAGYGLTGLLFNVTGHPPEILSYILSGLVALLLLLAAMNLLFWIYNKKNGERHKFLHSKLLTETLDALRRIAQGDFNVFVSAMDDRDPYGELAASVNKMAKELGSMEKLRQDFISNVSHEIQSPLTSICGYATLLKGDNVSPEAVSRYAGIIEAESRRLSKLSDNLLKLSALEADCASFACKPFRLDKQLQNVLLMLEPQWAGKNISPEVELAKIDFIGNEDLLSQVWINLLHNAIKFTPENGWIRVTLFHDKDCVACSIADNGTGISPEDQMHIFERFFKADKSRDRSLGGSGLGLSLVKKIVELHGGVVKVESEPGKGSVFTVKIPEKRECEDSL